MRGFIERLERERSDALATIDGALERAAAEDRDLTDSENSMLSDARTRLERVERERTTWAELAESRAQGDALQGRIDVALSRDTQLVRVAHAPEQQPEITQLFRDAGDYIHCVSLARAGDSEQNQRLQRAIANQLLADNPGVVPTPIIGPVVNLIDRARPFVNSVARKAMPGGGQFFTRPKVTAHTQVGEQTAEKTEVASRKMAVTPMNVQKHTFGGALDISFQNRDWTDPAILQIVVDDLAVQYGKETNNFLADYVASEVTATQEVPGTAPATGAQLLQAITTAAGTIDAAVGSLPDTLWASPDMWASIVSASDTTGRPLFVAFSPSNAPGSASVTSTAGNIFGLNLVVDSSLAAGTLILGISSLVEFYEQIGGQLSVTEPTILGFVVAYYGYCASLVVEPAGFVKLVNLA
jgi:HK97 family phage major capsid protein